MAVKALPGIPGGLWDHVPDGGEDPLKDLNDGGDHEEEDDGPQAPGDQALWVHAEPSRGSHAPKHEEKTISKRLLEKVDICTSMGAHLKQEMGAK